jgi:electron transport complex protein RnfG
MRETLNLGLRLALICGLAALLLSRVDAATRGPIAEAMRRAQMEAVSAVLPPYDNAPDADQVALGTTDAARIYYRGYRDDGPLPSGVAFTGLSERGYSGEIEFMLGVDAAGRVAGVRLLRHGETPGLGARYADPALLQSLYAGRSLADTHWREKADGGDLDAVTGATVTGRALAEAIGEALTRYAADSTAVADAPRGEPAATEEVLP